MPKSPEKPTQAHDLPTSPAREAVQQPKVDVHAPLIAQFPTATPDHKFLIITTLAQAKHPEAYILLPPEKLVELVKMKIDDLQGDPASMVDERYIIIILKNLPNFHKNAFENLLQNLAHNPDPLHPTLAQAALQKQGEFALSELVD